MASRSVVRFVVHDVISWMFFKLIIVCTYWHLSIFTTMNSRKFLHNYFKAVVGQDNLSYNINHLESTLLNVSNRISTNFLS